MTESNQPLIPDLPSVTAQSLHQQQKIFLPAPSPPQHQQQQQNFIQPGVSKSMPTGFATENLLNNYNTKSTSEIETQTQTDFVIDLDQSMNNDLTSNYMNAISNYAVFDELGNRHTMGELWSEFKTIFVFVRVSELTFFLIRFK